jgi:hypothetical protein
MLLSSMNPLSAHFNHVHTSAALSLQAGDFPHMPASKRPKLSLQTNALTTSYGSSASATGNKATDMTAATPTTLNTFNNTFDLSLRPSPNSATASPFRTTTISSPLRRKQPYSLNLPLGVKPILKNSRLAADLRRSSIPTSASPRSARRVFFPAPKKVSFQFNDETIENREYTARHIDLSPEPSDNDASGSDAGSDRSSPEPSEVETEIKEASPEDNQTTARPRLHSPEIVRGRARRQWSASTERRKKKRRWQWTLSEIEEGESPVKRESPDTNEPPVIEKEEAYDVEAIAASIPLPPDPETSRPESKGRHVSAMVKRFEHISSDKKGPCI